MAPVTIAAGPAMPLARQAATAVRLGDGRVLVIGGTVPFVGKCPMACVMPSTSSVEAFDPRTGRFTRNGSLVVERTGARALVLKDGRVLVTDTAWGPTQSMEIYDPGSGKSSQVKVPSSLGGIPQGVSIVLLADGRVLLAGGSLDSGATTRDVTMIFDATDGSFVPGPRLSTPRFEATGTSLPDGRVLLVGGTSLESHEGRPIVDAELLDLSQPIGTEVGSGRIAEGFTNPIVLRDGRVLLMPAPDPTFSSVCRVPSAPILFDPGTGTFSADLKMVDPRAEGVSVLLGDGRVLVMGGWDTECVARKTIEAFDPESGTFQLVSKAFPAPLNFTATLLDDGRVLVAGGGTADWNGMTNKSWLIKP